MGDKCSCAHLSAHKRAVLLEDECQVLVLVPLEEGVNLLGAARDSRTAAGASASAGCSALPPSQGARPFPAGFGRECWCRTSPTRQAIPPDEVSSLVFCSGSQALRKPAGLGQGCKKTKHRQGKRELHAHPGEKTAMNLNQGWGFFG